MLYQVMVTGTLMENQIQLIQYNNIIKNIMNNIIKNIMNNIIKNIMNNIIYNYFFIII